MDEQAGALLRELMSTDNETREKAEAQFDNIPPQQKLLFLLSCYSLPGQTDDQRLLSMILLRRLITSEFEKFYPVLPPDHQQQLKEHLLNSIQGEITPQVRNRICECAAELARKLADEEFNLPWPELPDRLLQWASNPNEAWRHAALHIFADFPGVFGPSNQPSMNLVKDMLHASLQAQDSMRVRVEAANAISSFLKSGVMNTPEKQAMFGDMIPLMVKLLADQKGQDDDNTVLEALTEICENCPKIVRPHLVQLLDVTLAYLQDDNTLESRQALCLEVVITLCESAPAMMRKLGQRHIDALLPNILKMMAAIEEDPSWDTNDNADQDEFESDSPSAMGESSLDRLAIALGGKQLLPSVMAVLAPLLNSANWMERHAALMAISAMGEGCKKQMMPMLDQIVGGVLNFLGDSHPRVRFAAINCLGQMANDFSPTFEKKFHATVLPRLCEILADNSHPRVQAHAGAALVNFFEECPKKIMQQYLNMIAPPLASILQNKMSELVTRGVKRVLEQVLVTTSALADSCSTDFIPYYDSFVPSIKYIIENANSTKFELLRGKAIECISLIGSAVGKERFASDASGVMDLLLQSQVTNNLSEDSQILSYMIYGWMRLCKILGKDFEKYLPYVMPSVMKTAALDPQTTVVDEDEVPPEANDEEWTYVPCDDHKSFGIRTVGLEEKATAFEMLLCYAKELKEGFGPYVAEVLKVTLPTLKFYFHEGVRISAAGCVPELLSCAKVNNMNVLEMWQQAAPQILSALEREHDMEVMPELVDCLAQCVNVVGPGGLNEGLVKEMMDNVLKFLQQHFERDQERHERRNDEDYDEDVEDQLQQEGEEDSYLLTRIEELIRQLCKALGSTMIPFLDEVVPLFGRLIQPDRPITDIQWAVCFYDDITECAGEQAALRYKDVFIHKLVDYIVHPAANIRQAASYGVGVIAKFGGEQLAPFLTKSLPLLEDIINRADSRSNANVVATENAISAVAKIIMHRPSAVPNINETISAYARWLPITEDAEEIAPCFELVCALMEQNNPALLGANNENLPHIMKCMAEVFGCKSLDKDTPVGQRCVALLKAIQANQELFQACLAQLTPTQQKGLQYALS
ncbi:importin-5-like [Tropilaelaps mercedesae]|uniref:Importin-5-like n=1 Tax=Tropilaelaps mercedesae TaxID=418985 RepID=A0A1V9XYK0_9ACAR|nr:importin-5-like [Tropilaelaps mercedesae]